MSINHKSLIISGFLLYTDTQFPLFGVVKIWEKNFLLK